VILGISENILIAAVLLDAEARHIPAIKWKNAALRKKINRVVVSSIALMIGSYLALLHGNPARAGDSGAYDGAAIRSWSGDQIGGACVDPTARTSP
jgi:hypothetical protein